MEDVRIDIGTFGDYLREEWLEPLSLSPYRLAKDLGISSTALSKILSGKNAMSVDTCWRLARYFGVSRNYFARMQDEYIARRNEEDFEKRVEGLSVYEWAETKADLTP